jgi:hypothetical protein
VCRNHCCQAIGSCRAAYSCQWLRTKPTSSVPVCLARCDVQAVHYKQASSTVVTFLIYDHNTIHALVRLPTNLRGMKLMSRISHVERSTLSFLTIETAHIDGLTTKPTVRRAPFALTVGTAGGTQQLVGGESLTMRGLTVYGSRR